MLLVHPCLTGAPKLKYEFSFIFRSWSLCVFVWLLKVELDNLRFSKRVFLAACRANMNAWKLQNKPLKNINDSVNILRHDQYMVCRAVVLSEHSGNNCKWGSIAFCNSSDYVIWSSRCVAATINQSHCLGC